MEEHALQLECRTENFKYFTIKQKLVKLEKESKTVRIDPKTWSTVSRLIVDYPEFGYKEVDEFFNDAIKEWLKVKSLEIGKTQAWMKKPKK